ncbi:MAG: hypothetical protein HND52_00925 [Ignavibacteriae bacterium]|jgi:hypothetical protein|nr:hypothetical protein [Ignavibacteriota bacterium]NOG96511.1 hypothetical protein [Ignavibacteriota bacterium]
MLKNITLSADENLIKKAREKAMREKTTLNESFRQWLKQFVNSSISNDDYHKLIENLKYAKSGRKFSRSEMNES